MKSVAQSSQHTEPYSPRKSLSICGSLTSLWIPILRVLESYIGANSGPLALVVEWNMIASSLYHCTDGWADQWKVWNGINLTVELCLFSTSPCIYYYLLKSLASLHFLNVKLFPLSSFLARFNPVDVSSAFWFGSNGLFLVFASLSSLSGLACNTDSALA
jgi:hypothetical protein